MPLLPEVTGSRQEVPQPFEQHLAVPKHVTSLVHCRTQDPVLMTAGHVPGFCC